MQTQTAPCLLRRARHLPSREFEFPATLSPRAPGPAKNHLQIQSDQKCAYLQPKSRTPFPINIWPGEGDRGQESQKEPAARVCLDSPARPGSGRAQLTTGTARLISTWRCRNPIRGVQSLGQPRHVNLFSMCAAPRSQTTGAQEARPQPQPQQRSSGGVNKELKASKYIEVAGGSGRAARRRARLSATDDRVPQPSASRATTERDGASRAPELPQSPRAGSAVSRPGPVCRGPRPGATRASAPAQRGGERERGPSHFEHF